MKGAVNGVWVAAAVALVVGACALGGCEPRITAGFSSRLYSANAPPIERLLIVPDMKSQAFGDSMYHGFETGLIKRLSLCGVQPRILVLDALELEPEQRFAQVANEFHATAAMFINPLGGKLHSVNGNLTSAELVFELKLFHVESKQLVWLARSI